MARHRRAVERRSPVRSWPGAGAAEAWKNDRPPRRAAPSPEIPHSPANGLRATRAAHGLTNDLGLILLAGQDQFTKTRQPAKAVAGTGRQTAKGDDGGRVIGPLYLAPHQPLGPECEHPADDLG